MLKFEKDGKKLMEVDSEGKIVFHDKAFEKKMQDVVEREKGKDNDEEE